MRGQGPGPRLCPAGVWAWQRRCPELVEGKTFNGRLGWVILVRALQRQKNYLIFHLAYVQAFGNNLQILNTNANGHSQLVGINDT